MSLVSPTLRRAVLRRHGKVCLRCGRGGPMTMDHIIPLALGGQTAVENLQPLCVACNRWKGSRVIDYRGGVQGARKRGLRLLRLYREGVLSV